MKTVMFYCQHVLGMGHLVRSMQIVRALKGYYRVHFVNGGESIRGVDVPEGVRVINLSPLRSDAHFKTIESSAGIMDLEQVKTARRQQLLSEFERIQPDILMIELFPFGRKKFAFELVSLLDRIRSDGLSTRVVCSLRDILVEKSDQARYEQRVCELMNRYFDLLLVHADPDFQRLDETFFRVADIQAPIRYTGYVGPSSETDVGSDDVAIPQTSAEPLIVASVGGGRVGHELLECTLRASVALKARCPHRLTLFAGPYMPEPEYASLKDLVEGESHIELQRYTNRFLSYLKGARLSVSQAGYNTCMDIIATGVRSLVLPFTGGENQEQTIRAHKLEQRGVVTVIRPDDLAPERFANIIARAMTATHRTRRGVVDVNGAQNSASALRDLLNATVTGGSLANIRRPVPQH